MFLFLDSSVNHFYIWCYKTNSIVVNEVVFCKFILNISNYGASNKTLMIDYGDNRTELIKLNLYSKSHLTFFLIFN
jgi:hypothetical protein